jgi:hypothetical protein
MKQKMLKLVLFFLTISLFSSSKDHTDIAKCKCLPEDKLQESEILKTAGGGGVDEYPLTMLPGSYLLIY